MHIEVMQCWDRYMARQAGGYQGVEHAGEQGQGFQGLLRVHGGGVKVPTQCGVRPFPHWHPESKGTCVLASESLKTSKTVPSFSACLLSL